jgi:single-stranded-DNA-specific exonuclease
MQKQWVFREQVNKQLVETLSKEINVSLPLASLLAQRGIQTFDQAKNFFRPDLNDLHDPFLMKGMPEAVNRLCEAVFSNEKILVYGDYDVDGTTAVATVYSFLKKYTEKVSFYVPDRYTEGYGVSEKGVRWAVDEKFDLMICLDCGIRAVKNIALAKDLGLDVIVCDHHLPGEVLPPALAILDPKQKDCQYPFKELCGCGVGFKLLQGFCQQNTIDFKELYEFLDLVAVSIGSDIVPIVGENRILAFYGLQKINQQPSAGLKALKDISGFKNALSISDVVFYLGPRINAAGRLSHAKESVNLLINENENELLELAKVLNDRNVERKDFDQSITAEALEIIEKDFPNTKSSVLFKNDWHKGVVGIVASRCIEQYYRPTIILTESEGVATGSARSVDGFDIHEAIGKCEHLLLQYGGHQHAAGLSLSLENVDAFRNAFEEEVNKTITPDQLFPKLLIDLEVDFDFLSFKTLGIINQMAPFGPQNMQPIFVTRNVYIKNKPRILKDAHLKLMLYQEGYSGGFEAIGFGFGDMADKIVPNMPFEIAYHLEQNEFQGNKTLQLNLKDIKIAE